MNEGKLKSALIQMKAGDRRKESWFTEQGVSKDDLNEAVMLGYLIPYEKDPNDFMSNNGYIMTTDGRDFAWS